MRLLTSDELEKKAKACLRALGPTDCWFCKKRMAEGVCIECEYGCCKACSRFGDCPLCYAEDYYD